MADQLPRVQPTSGIGDIASILGSLGPMFGSGEQTTQSQKIMDPQVAAQLQQLLSSILGGNDAAEMDEMVENILNRAKQTFAPIIGQSIGSGARAYSDTTLKQLANEAMARATAEAAQVKLEAINKNNALAAQLVSTQAQSTGFTTQTQETAASPMGKMLGYGAAALTGYSLYKKYFDKSPKPQQEKAPVEERSFSGVLANPADEFAGTPLKGYFEGYEGADPSEFSPFGSAGPDTGSIPGEFNPLMNQGLDPTAFFDPATSAGALEVLTLADTGVDTVSGLSLAAGDSIDVSSFSGLTMVDDIPTAVASGATDAFSGFAAEAGAEGITEIAGESVGGFLESGLDVATGGIPIIGPAINVAQGDYGAAAGAVVGSIFGPIGSVVGGAVGGFIDEESVICSHVYSSGDISRRYYLANARYGQSNREILKGYQIWGRPFVQIMKASPLMYKLGRSMALHHAKYISGERTIFGFFLNKVLAPLSGLIWRLCGARLKKGDK